MTINNNIPSMLAGVNNKKTELRLKESLERLSSGYKINKAADDASGMAITNKMRTQIRALDQASRNAADGNSVIETAEGAINEIGNILQRVRELSVQAANDTNTLEDRQSIELEVDSMLEEIDRISSTTQFNGQNLLDGSLSHTAAADNKSVHAMQTSMSVEAGEYSFTLTEAAEQAGRSDPLTVTEPPVGKSVLINDAEIKNDGSGDFKEKVKKACDTMNLDYDPDSGKVMSKAFGAKVSLSVQNDGQEKKTVYGKDSVIRLTTVNEGAGFKAGATYKADGNDITIVDNNGFEMNIQIKGEDASKTAGKEIKVNVFEAGYLMDQVGSNEGQFLGINIAKTDCCSLGIKNFDGTNNVNCCTRTGAGNAITIFDEAIRRLSNTRSQLGAYENRLDAVVRNLGVSTENLTNAMSRIGDTDIAEEMSNYTSLDVQNQAATSMLAQSNNRTKEVLNLLQA